jgi:hypothetical protein
VLEQLHGQDQRDNWFARLQTDDSALVEGSRGFGVIKFGCARVQRRALPSSQVPLNTKMVSMLNGALTVLRARERSTLTWREPFSSEIGSARKVNGFEITLTKCEIAGDTLVAEWNCKAPVDAAGDAKLWQARQLKAALTCADKTRGPELERKTPRRFGGCSSKKEFRRRWAAFISDLKMENLPFTVTGYVGGQRERARTGIKENF